MLRLGLSIVTFVEVAGYFLESGRTSARIGLWQDFLVNPDVTTTYPIKDGLSDHLHSYSFQESLPFFTHLSKSRTW